MPFKKLLRVVAISGTSTTGRRSAQRSFLQEDTAGCSIYRSQVRSTLAISIPVVSKNSNARKRLSRKGCAPIFESCRIVLMNIIQPWQLLLVTIARNVEEPDWPRSRTAGCKKRRRGGFREALSVLRTLGEPVAPEDIIGTRAAD